MSKSKTASISGAVFDLCQLVCNRVGRWLAAAVCKQIRKTKIDQPNPAGERLGAPENNPIFKALFDDKTGGASPSPTADA